MKLRSWCEMFPKWENDQREQWESLSKKGQFSFVLKQGVLFYGGWCAFGVTALMHLSPQFDEPLLELAKINVAIFALVGVIYGQTVWWATSKSYEEHFGDQQD